MVTYCLVTLFSIVAATGAPVPDPFTLEGTANLMHEEDLGIVNGHITAGIPYSDAAAVSGLWAPPYVSSDFRLDIKIDGVAALTDRYKWSPFSMERSGAIGDITISTVTALLADKRAGMIQIVLRNNGATEVAKPLACALSSTLDKVEMWEFARAASQSPTTAVLENNALLLRQGDAALIAQCAGMGRELVWDTASRTASGTMTLPPGQTFAFAVVFAMGPEAEARAACSEAVADPAKALNDARRAYEQRVATIFARLPYIESANPAFNRFYIRSLVHLLTNRWDVPEFVLHPYYSTGSVKGGCVCNYLWNFGEVWEILPLYDPEAARAHIEQFLRVDMFNHFSFIPTTGAAFGPWYPVNQEKIVGLIYYYVKLTGDKDFLNAQVEGKTVLEHVVANALCRDEETKPVDLIDYGSSNSHLELRREYAYNHVMPDLNGRRYMNYMRAAELAELGGHPFPQLRDRAGQLKRILKERLWDADAKWFRFLGENGAPELRYTMQIFKLFDSGILDEEEEKGLLSHLNETEFLSAQGFHSMSKTDPAYDQVDIDNGGGGACTCFPPQIAERLYRAGHVREADDILQRILWWGEKLPYWGDSIVANAYDYRRDTPLQCTLDGAAVAQCVVFGLLGISADFDGNVTFNPHTAPFAPGLKLIGLQLRGRCFDLEMDDARKAYTVKTGGQELKSFIGDPIRWNAVKQCLEPMSALSNRL